MIPLLPDEEILRSIAPLIIRMTLAVFFMYFGLRSLTKRRSDLAVYFKGQFYPGSQIIPWLLGISTFGLSIMLAFGAYGRTSAVMGLYIIASLLYAQREVKIFPYNRRFYILLLAMLLSLLFSGPGYLAFDTIQDSSFSGF